MCEHKNIRRATSAEMQDICVDCGQVLIDHANRSICDEAFQSARNARQAETWAMMSQDAGLRQLVMAEFLMSVANMASDLRRLNLHVDLVRGALADERDERMNLLEAQKCCQEIEDMIRNRSIQVFGSDIFFPRREA